MIFHLFLVLLPLVLLALGFQNHATYVLHESRLAIPARWSGPSDRDPSAVILMCFGLAQTNIDDIGQYLVEVSHPDSPAYSQHWTAAKVAKTFAASPQSVQTVQTWLIDSGLTQDRIKLTPGRNWIEVNATIAEAEELLQTQYGVYQHRGTGQKHLASLEYSVPAHVQSHIDFATPTVHFDSKVMDPSGLPKTAGTVDPISANAEYCDSQLTLDCLRALYEIPSSTLFWSEGNSFGIVEYTPQAYNQDDLNMFFKKYANYLNGTSPTLVSVDGGAVDDSPRGFYWNGESNLDLQYAMGLVSASQDITLYQTGDQIESASFNTFLDAIDGPYCKFQGGDDPSQDPQYPDPHGYNHTEDCGSSPLAYVISTSYTYDEHQLTERYASRQCAEYAKLGLMGVTMLFSSGDNGVAGNYNKCLTVGNVCGGFSNYFGLPGYQETAVQSYLKNHSLSFSSGVWNSTGMSRAYPDVSANGADYVVVVDGSFYSVFGTSASSPVFGAILTWVNNARLTVGKRPIGFINPAIYSDYFKAVFNDITNGTNPGCGTNGFSTAPGWDPVTGLGTPNVPRMIEAWMTLP